MSDTDSLRQENLEQQLVPIPAAHLAAHGIALGIKLGAAELTVQGKAALALDSDCRDVLVDLHQLNVRYQFGQARQCIDILASGGNRYPRGNTPSPLVHCLAPFHLAPQLAHHGLVALVNGFTLAVVDLPGPAEVYLERIVAAAGGHFRRSAACSKTRRDGGQQGRQVAHKRGTGVYLPARVFSSAIMPRHISSGAE